MLFGRVRKDIHILHEADKKWKLTLIIGEPVTRDYAITYIWHSQFWATEHLPLLVKLIRNPRRAFWPSSFALVCKHSSPPSSFLS